MIKAHRVIISSSIPHQYVTISTPADQQKAGTPQIFENQLHIEDVHGRELIIESSHVSDIQWKLSKFKKEDVIKVCRLICTYDQVGYCPCHILKKECHAKYGIPSDIYPEEEIAFFTPDGYLHISSIDNIVAVCL